MAKFIDKKNKVYDFQITPYGTYLLSIGRFKPEYYAFFDVDNFILSPTPDSNYAVELHYYYRPDSITKSPGADSQTTWLSENAPNALLYGSLMEAYIYMKGEQDMLQMYEKQFAEALSRIKDLAEARENSDAYRRGLPDRPRT